MTTAGPRSFELTERIIYLRAIPVAAMLPPSVLNRIASYLVERRFPKGTLLQKAGEPFTRMQLLTQGSVRLVHDGKDAGELKPPQSLGFLGLLARSDAPYDAYAGDDVEALELGAEPLFDLLEDHFSLLESSLRYTSERLLHELIEMPSEQLGNLAPPVAAPVPDHELDIVERIFFLRRMSSFKNCNLNALTVMAGALVEKRPKPGTLLWNEGDSSDGVIMLVSGKVECTSSRGQSWIYQPPMVIGGIESMAEKPRWYKAVAGEDLVYMQGASDKLMDLLEENFPMALDFVAFVAAYLQQILQRKALSGGGTYHVHRAVSELGPVPVGA